VADGWTPDGRTKLRSRLQVRQRESDITTVIGSNGPTLTGSHGIVRRCEASFTTYPNIMQASTVRDHSFGRFVSRKIFPREPSPTICSDARLQNYISVIMLASISCGNIYPSLSCSPGSSSYRCQAWHHQNLSDLSVAGLFKSTIAHCVSPVAVSRDSPTTPIQWKTMP
jgi:hypothetical protein